jgi:hypothetical protein
MVIGLLMSTGAIAVLVTQRTTTPQGRTLPVE